MLAWSSVWSVDERSAEDYCHMGSVAIRSTKAGRLDIELINVSGFELSLPLPVQYGTRFLFDCWDEYWCNRHREKNDPFRTSSTREERIRRDVISRLTN